MHFIYYINRLTTTKVDSTYLGCLTSNAQRICPMAGLERLTLSRHTSRPLFNAEFLIIHKIETWHIAGLLSKSSYPESRGLSSVHRRFSMTRATSKAISDDIKRMITRYTGNKHRLNRDIHAIHI